MSSNLPPLSFVANNVQFYQDLLSSARQPLRNGRAKKKGDVVEPERETHGQKKKRCASNDLFENE